MSNHKQIDWSQVVPGKTWLESPNGCMGRVDAIVGEDVWFYYQSEQNLQPIHYTWTKHSLSACKWQIREEWEDVTDECIFVWMEVEEAGEVLVVYHQNKKITDPFMYWVKSDGIYKRRSL